MIDKEDFGTLPDGNVAEVYTLRAGDITARVSTFGATLVGLTVPDADGTQADIVLGFDTLADYAGENGACYGATVGPVANRTAGAEVTIDGTVYHLQKNEGENNLHSDLLHGLHKRLWRVENAHEQPDGVAVLELSCVLANGALGLPGNRVVRATFAVDPANQLTIRYRMETDAPTYANITNHSYFNLAGHASGSVLEQVVQIDAERFVAIGAGSIPTGELRPVAGTPFDFSIPRAIGARIEDTCEQLGLARGYDHCFCIDGYEPDAQPRHALHAEDPASGRAMDLAITAPGLQLYTGNWLGDEHAKAGASYTPRDGFALEPQFYPDATHHADWPQPVCTPEHPFSSTMVYTFSVTR